MQNILQSRLLGPSNAARGSTTSTGAKKRHSSSSQEEGGADQKCQKISKVFGRAKSTGLNEISSKKQAATSVPSKPSLGAVIGEELVCPITLQLPLDPVIAEDGRVYDRQAIESHIQRNTGTLKSPITNLSMGPRLFPSQPIKNIIEHGIESGEISGELAEAWRESKKEADRNKKQIDDWKAQALDGNGDSAVRLGICYQWGDLGIRVDEGEANRWWKLAAEAGRVEGYTKYGNHLLKNRRTREQGLLYLTQAASMGCRLACFILGSEYTAVGQVLPTNSLLAAQYLQQGLAPDTGTSILQPAQSYIQSMTELLSFVVSALSPEQRIYFFGG